MSIKLIKKNMRLSLILTFVFLVYSFTLVPADLKVIKSVQIDKNHYAYKNSIEEYKNSEEWTIWSVPITGLYRSSSDLKKEGIFYYEKNCLTDHNLDTYWSAKSLNENIVVVFHNPELFGTGLEFYGKINLFNGCCASESLWNDYSRVKKLKVYFNRIPLCIVELKDTWQFQSFDISSFFKNIYQKKNMNAPYEIKKGDYLVFEVVDIYKGNKFNEIIISEFMAEGAPN